MKLCVQYSVPDLNRDGVSSVFHAGPQTNDMSERISERIPKEISKRMLENMTERM